MRLVGERSERGGTEGVTAGVESRVCVRSIDGCGFYLTFYERADLYLCRKLAWKLSTDVR